MGKVVVVGEAPGRGGGPPLGGRVGARLSGLLGADVSKVARLANLLDAWPGRSTGKGAGFPIDDARRAAAAMQLGTSALFLGKRVARAFGIRSPDYFRIYGVRGARVAVFPHPSGVNRFWNDPRNERVAMLFIRAFFRAHSGG